ncbi:MAG TPA: DUF3365 domain-containing protein [Pseudomonadales bacterium]
MAPGAVRGVMLLGLWMLAAAAAAADAEPADGQDHRLAESRALVGDFAARLQLALTAALEAGGPLAAIPACRDTAPAIAAAASRASGAAIGRTSDRFRNPLNAPEPWQSVVLRTFGVQMATGVASVPEYFAVAEDGSARYMKAIPLAPLCSACHGTALAPEVADRLDADYPHDRARGYAPGDLRGAFTVFWPAPD